MCTGSTSAPSSIPPCWGAHSSTTRRSPGPRPTERQCHCSDRDAQRRDEQLATDSLVIASPRSHRMSYFHTSDDEAQAQEEPREHREGRLGRERKRQSIAELGGRVARWFAGIDDDELDDQLDDQATAEHDPMAAL